MDIARLDQFPSMHTLGFVLGPRLNAGGRLGCSDLGVQILYKLRSRYCRYAGHAD